MRKLLPVLTVILFASCQKEAEKITWDANYISTNDALYGDIATRDTVLTADLINVTVAKSYEQFKEDLAYRESTNVYDTINTLGYLGLYQIGRSLCKDLGIDYTDFKENLSDVNPVYQDIILDYSLRVSMNYLGKYTDLINTKVNGIYITKSSMLAAAHLLGHGGFKKWVRNPNSKKLKDSYGTNIIEYINTFSGYDLNHITPISRRKAKKELKDILPQSILK